MTIAVGVLGPTGVKAADFDRNGDPICFTWFRGFNVPGCFAVAGNLVLRIVSSVLYFAGKFFNVAVNLSLNKFETYS